ncbi:MAG: hypothetical protein PHE43_00935 [Candidatus Nanoarchaeia archaeon]|nr:hypothetical protein [Candidatus Nanoarchaeia archaeon]
MKKRGEMQLFMLFSILVAVIVVASLGYYVASFKNSRALERRANTIDIGLTLDTLYLSKNSKISYDINKDDDLEITINLVKQGLFNFNYYPSNVTKLNWKQEERKFEVSS